jgi:uncharacterized protein (DUF2141 family)
MWGYETWRPARNVKSVPEIALGISLFLRAVSLEQFQEGEKGENSMKFWAIVLLIWFTVCNLTAENNYGISGRVLISEEGVLYIYLVDEEQFSIPFTGIKALVFPISSVHLERGSVPFALQNIPAGRYGIRVFIDINDNGKLDRGLSGPKEPWGMSWQESRVARIPRFRDIAFQLAGDIHGLDIDSRRE